MMGTLEKLLECIRDGVASPEEVARARELVAHDARLPDELREIGLTDEDDLPGDAVGLLAVLGAAPLFDEGLREALSDVAAEVLADGEEEHDAEWEAIAEVLREGLVAAAEGVEVVGAVMARLPAPAWSYGPATAEAVRSEAGTVDVAGDAMADLGDALPPVAEAVAAEAGEVDVVSAVLSELSLEGGVPVGEAVAAEAGEVDVVSAVLSELSLEGGVPVGEAVAAEAGEVDVVAAVVEELGLASVREAVTAEAGQVDVADQVLDTVAPAQPSVLQEAPALPAPANRGWTWGAVVMAAVALLVVGLSQLPGLGGSTEDTDLVFASAGELVVEDLEFADDVTVIQAEGDEGAVILWMEDV